jgi:hypothetical protein
LKDLTYSCDDSLILPWYLNIAPLHIRASVGIECTIMIIMVPNKIAIDEARDGDGTKLDETKEEEQVETSCLRAARSGISHCKHAAWVCLKERYKGDDFGKAVKSKSCACQSYI